MLRSQDNVFDIEHQIIWKMLSRSYEMSWRADSNSLANWTQTRAEIILFFLWPFKNFLHTEWFIETEETKFDVNNLDELTVKNSLYSMPMVWHTCLHWSWVNLVWWAFFAGSSWLDSLELKKKNRRYMRTIWFEEGNGLQKILLQSIF